jgi:tetratricopeptide (TPR) repeat protein
MYEATMHSYEAAGNSDEVKTLYKRLATFIQENNFRTEKAMMVLVKNRELNPLPPPLSTLPEISTEELNKLTGKDYSSFSRTVEPVEEASFGEDESQTSSKIPGFSESITFTSTGELVRTGTGEEIELPEAQTGASTAVAPEEPGTNAPTEMTIPEIFPTELINQDQNQYAMPYLRASKDFLQRDLLMAATDAAHEMIRYFPEYLPAQTVLAEIYVKKGWLEMARTKYQFVVDLYERRGDSAKQLWAYRRLATISPQNMQLRSKLANKLMENGMKEEAAELLLDALDNYVRSGQIDRALDECRKLRTIAPNNTNIRLQYGELLNRVDKYNEALVEFRRALEIDPDNLRALCQLNITLFLSDTTDLRWTSFKSVLDASAGNKEARNKVITEYRQALFLFNHPGLNYVLGCLNIEAQQVNPAIRSFDEVLRMASMDPAMTEYELLSRWELSQLYIQAVRYNEAIDMMTRVVSLLEKVDAKGFIGPGYRYGSLPTQASIYRKMAESFNALGQKEYAVKALKSVKRLLPYDRQVYFELAELYFEQGQLSEALNELGELAEHYEQSSQTENVVEVLKEMTRLAPNNIEVRDKLATVYLNRGMTDLGLSELDLLADLQKKVGKMKDAVRSLQRGAEIYFMMGRLDRAFELYDRIVRIAPGDIEARQHLVNLHILAGRMKDAIDEQRTIAQICLQNNNMQEAIGALHQVIGLSPDDTRAYFTLADVLKNVGKYGEAYRLYGQIIKREPDNDKAKALQSQIKQKAIEAGQLDADKVK